MFKLLLILSLLTFYQPSYAAEDTVNQAVARYLTRIHKYMEEEDWENAERELIQTARRYFKNEDSYERALINQLYGQFYALQRDYKSAIPWFEKALAKSRLPFAADLQVTYSLSQCYFQTGRYKDVIKTLENYRVKASKRGQNMAPVQLMVLGIAYFQEADILNAYTNISEANATATKLNEEWLQYEFALAVKLEKFDEAINVGQFLVFVNPEKKSYWKQLSGVYYGSESEELSLAGLELAYENDVLDKEKDYIDLARYFMYKELPIKAIDVLNDGINIKKVKQNRKNYEFLADAYFLAKDRVKGIDALIKAEALEKDADLSYKIARFAFENEDWSKAITYFSQAKKQGYEKYPGRLELLLGISYFEISNYEEALASLNESLEFDSSNSAAEGWISYIKDILGTQNS
ncbi:MAG: tetratricopeptide repeat protein [Candidatus Neomarinimicrobiota bacterium]|jgi:tetratricopeptide (TPR) repeat protein